MFESSHRSAGRDLLAAKRHWPTRNQSANAATTLLHSKACKMVKGKLVCDVRPAGRRATGLFGGYNHTEAERLVLYERAIRCLWPMVASWNCTSCKDLMPGSKLLGSYITGPVSESAADAFIVSYDRKFKNIIVTFRSTYGNFAGWFSNFMFQQRAQKVGNQTYQVHSGFAESYYSILRPRLYKILLPATKKYPNADIIFLGHSRGGGLAVVAAVDAAVERASDLGLNDPYQQVNLVTMGQPLVGGPDYVKLIEHSIRVRYRIRENADIVCNLPPDAESWNGEYSLLRLGAKALGINVTEINKWIGIANYVHHGPLIASLNYSLPIVGKVVADVVCDSSSFHYCDYLAWSTMVPNAGRPYSGWDWPLWLAGDHQYYLGIDLDNQECRKNGL